MLSKRLYSAKNLILELLLNGRVNINEDAIWVFGMPKSGTTAIAGLMSKMSNSSVTLDTKYLWEPYISLLKDGHVDFGKHIQKYSYPFSKKIIKEPVATEFYYEIKQEFKLDNYIVITRNPYDNIRSILNRMKIEGNKTDININDVSPGWRRDLGYRKGVSYIQALAEMWNDYYDEKIIYNKSCVIVKYEDFQQNKSAVIRKACKSVGLVPLNSIASYENVQYQPKGNSDVNIHKFYGNDNLDIITKICSSKMKQLNYDEIT